MIIYGARGKVITGKPIKNYFCQHCDNESHLSFGVLRYFHIYWIPIFVFQKKTGLECLHCKKTIFDREISQDIRSQIANQIFTRQNTLPLFSGLAIIVALMLIWFMSST